MDVKRINSSSIAEIVIALAIISMCFTVASLVFIRATNSTLKFQQFKDQTRVQSLLMEMMVEQEVDLSAPDFQNRAVDVTSDSIVAVEYVGNDDRIIWRQEWIKAKK